VHGPRGLVDLLGSLKRVVGKLSYEVRVVELEPGDVIERAGYRLAAFEVAHGVPAVGWSLIEATRPGRFDVETADALGVPSGPARGALQRGESVTLPDGSGVSADQVLGPPRPGRKIVITGDTAPSVTEATFSEEELERAQETMHQTAAQAAGIAQRANIGLLALTHLSNRYFGPEIAREAREIFPDTIVPKDFDVVEVPFAERGTPQLVKGGALHRPEPEAVSSAPQ